MVVSKRVVLELDASKMSKFFSTLKVEGSDDIDGEELLDLSADLVMTCSMEVLIAVGAVGATVKYSFSEDQI